MNNGAGDCGSSNEEVSLGGAQQEDEDAAAIFSREKLQAVADSLSSWITDKRCIIRQIPCLSAHDSVGYRCRCAFQCILDDQNRIHYAIRRQNEAVVSDTFPIANHRIQRAMAGLLEILNNDDDFSCSSSLRNNLTSVSFSTSWREEESDCLVTLHYDQAIEDLNAWKAQAKNVCDVLGFTQLTGRSRKRVTRAWNSNEKEPCIRDTVWIAQRSNVWNVDTSNSHRGGDMEGTRAFPVYYEKPEGAFAHPNSRVMCRALEWMLSRLSLMTTENGRKQKPCLLELYCGCGAHTVALLKTGLLDKIVAVEYDDRLVKSCHRNCALNQQPQSCKVESDESPTQVEVALADAAIWARDHVASRSSNNFDILLVDPPRQGLDPRVCQMAIKGRFEHFLYISCGRDALVRDLGLLSTAFEVVDCTLLDLFPQTDAVESLVHLQRRKKPVND